VQGRTGRLSAHFNAAEFACPHCHVAVVRDQLLAVLERIRARTDTPLHIVSGYRCPVHNAQINGAANSMHMYGAAADLAPGSCTIAIARSAGAVGVGTKGQWVLHVDVRDGAPASWVYK
jgi:uncharacterized protein YcbK (DUF882 family)